MNHEKEQADLLAPLRALPAEVDLDQVAHMVAVFPPTPGPASWLSTLSNNLNILLMTASTLLISLGLYFFTGHAQTASAPPHTPPVEVIVPVADTPRTAPVEAIAPMPTIVPPMPAPPTPVMVTEVVPHDVVVPDDLVAAPSTPLIPLAPNTPLPVIDTTTAAKPGERTYAMSNFRGVEVVGSVHMTVEAGDFAVAAVADEDVLERLVVKVEGGVLTVHVNSQVITSTSRKRLFGGTVTKVNGTSSSCGPVSIHVRMPELEQAKVQGSGSITFGSFSTGKELALSVLGSGRVVSDAPVSARDLAVSVQGSGFVECRQVNVEGKTTVSVKGSGRAELAGETGTMVLDLQGSGSIHATEFSARKSAINLAGSGQIHVRTAPEQTVQSAGSGKVHTRN